MIELKIILEASAKELEKCKGHLPDDQSENVAQEMFIKGAEWAVNFISAKPLVSRSKTYGISLEEAKKVMSEFPEEDDYVQAHYQQFLRNGEHDDNTIESSNHWNKCKKIVEEGWE